MLCAVSTLLEAASQFIIASSSRITKHPIVVVESSLGRSFHTTDRKKQNTQPEPKEHRPKAADLNAASGSWGKQQADPNSVPRGIGGMGPVVITIGLLFITCTAWFGYVHFLGVFAAP